MSDLFLKIVNMSISASWLVLVVLLLRFVLKKAPKWASVLLWGIVAVRLVLPFSIESVLSLIPTAQTISPDIMMDSTPSVQTGIPAINSVINPVIGSSFTPDPGASVNPLQIWIPVLSVIWLVGVAALLVYTVVSYWRLRRKVSEAVILRDNIYQSENAGSPFVLGLIKPKIYLPYHTGEQDLSHVVAHEQAHIRRRDHWWKPLGFLLLTIHWFNPLMWLAYVLLCRDIELACDEKVIKELSNEQRADYTQALVTCSVNRRMIAACPLAFGEVGVKERVKSVMNYKKPAFWIIILAIIACVVVAVCFLTNPVGEEHPDDGYYLLIGADGVESVEISLPNSGGGIVNADGSPFKQGEKLWLEHLQGVTDLRGLKIVALGADGEVVYALSVPENATDAEIINTVGGDGWLIVPSVFEDESVPDKVSFKAEILEIHDGYYLVKPEPTWAINSADRIEVPMRNMYPSPEPQIGDIIEITYSGEILETYPARIKEVYGIRVVTENTLPLNTEADRIIGYSALYSEELINEAFSVAEREFYRRFGNCTLTELRYDEEIENRYAEIQMNWWNNNGQELITVYSTFETSEQGSGACVWYLVRTEDKKSWDYATWEHLGKNISLNDVIILSQKGYDLTWSDFEQFKYIETGSGLYIRVYEINEMYELWIGGGSPDSDPMYIYLALADDLDTRIDIRDGGVDKFIATGQGTQWNDGIAFDALAPNEEILSASEIVLEEPNSTVECTIGYARTGLTLTYGLIDNDGKEYSLDVVGGHGRGSFENLPAGSYRLFVRNSDYSGVPAYENPEDFPDVSFDATGVINYKVK